MVERMLHSRHEAFIKVEHVDVNGRINPLGIDTKIPVFHYTVISTDKDKGILFHQIIMKNGIKTVWNSGKIHADGRPYIRYEGPELRSKTQYTVEIRVWDEQNQESPFSVPITFEVGLLDEGFCANWIEPVQEEAIEEVEIPYFHVFRPSPNHYGGHVRCQPAQNIRKSFPVNKQIKKARIYASAHGIYTLYINGEKAGNTFLEPGISMYQKYLYYQTYDVTSLLISGENVLAVTVADGWWIGRIGLIGSSCQYGKRLGFILQMEIDYEDGDKLIVCSDESFRCHESEITYADLYIGEKQDNTKEQQGWRMPGFNVTNWDTCETATFVKDNLIGQPIDGIIEYQYLIPEKWIITPKGECVIDFGQVIAGTIEITVRGTRNQEIIFEYGEVLDEEGNYLRNIMGRNKDQTDVLVCRDGIQTWRPSYTYHGFRYVKLSGIQKSQVIKMEAVILTTQMEKTGEFCCSDERLTQLHQNIVWSERGNMMSIPTDCPQREKMGWTGDIQIFAKTGAFNYNIRNFLETWLMNLRGEQMDDGAVPVVVPNFPKQELMQRQIGNGEITSSGWSDTCILLPWYLYASYGDVTVLKENMKCIKRYLEFVKKQAALVPEDYEKMTEKQKKRNPYLWNKGYHFGDWLIPSLQKLPNGINEGRQQTRAVVGSAWYAISIETYIQICQALEKEAGWDRKREIIEKKQLLKRIRQAIKSEYVAKDGTVAKGDLQGLYVMVLRSGAVEGKLKKKVVEKLVCLIRENGNCLDTGFSSVSFLLDVLTENGYKDVVYKLLFQTKSPSWLYMVEHGATTIWENWEAITSEGKVTNASYNHYAYGCVGDWIYRNIGGITAGKPGYKHIIFTPDFDCGLSYSSCSHITPFGKVACDWQIVDRECSIDLVIPVNTTAELRIHDVVIKLVSGNHCFNIQLSECKKKG